MSPWVTLVDGVPGELIPVHDRGFLYGDGIFETMARRNGRVALWDYHVRRMNRSCEALGFESADSDLLSREIDACSGPEGDWLVRVTLTRGDGQGYAAPVDVKTRRVVQARPMIEGSPAVPLSVGVSSVRLGDSPQLAGIKHLCRLEQVLARTALTGEADDDHLMLDQDDQLIEGTQGNVFLMRDGEWMTPSLRRCGVAGVYREYLLERMSCKVREIPIDELSACSAMFLCNAVRGIQPIAEVAGIGSFDASIVERLQRSLT